jgi:hypothetical protein
LKLKDVLTGLLLEQADPDGVFSSAYTQVNIYTQPERVFFRQYRLEPTIMNPDVPPPQVQWQWTEERDHGNVKYGVMFSKQIFNDQMRLPPVESEEHPKRYRVVTMTLNDANGNRGIVLPYCEVSETFTEPYNIEVLESFLDGLGWLQRHYQQDVETPSFFGPASGFPY